MHIIIHQYGLVHTLCPLVNSFNSSGFTTTLLGLICTNKMYYDLLHLSCRTHYRKLKFSITQLTAKILSIHVKINSPILGWHTLSTTHNLMLLWTANLQIIKKEYPLSVANIFTLHITIYTCINWTERIFPQLYVSFSSFSRNNYVVGSVPSTGASTQAITSYMPEEIIWGHRFEMLDTIQKRDGKVLVDYSKFQLTMAVDNMPLCSAAALAQTWQEPLSAAPTLNGIVGVS